MRNGYRKGKNIMMQASEVEKWKNCRKRMKIENKSIRVRRRKVWSKISSLGYSKTVQTEA